MRLPRLSELPAPPPDRTGWPWTKANAPLPDTMRDERPWPRISIVTPSYNQGQFIEETIRSILLQGYPNLEYIVIDGGSTDNSVEIIKNYEPWLAYWASEKDNGHAHALNKGFARASGDIMSWLNSDDIHLSGACVTVAEVMAQFPEIEWLTSGFPTVCDVAGNVSKGRVYGFSRKFFVVGGYMGLAYSTGWIQQESTFWKRSLWEKTGARMDESYSLAIDFELWSRFIRHSGLATVETPLGSFRMYPQQRSRNHAAIYRQECFRALGIAQPHRLVVPATWYHQLRLYKVVPWRQLVRYWYGEKVSRFHKYETNAWRKEMVWTA